MRSTPDTNRVYLDTLGKLHERRHTLFGTCDDCAERERTSGHFTIDLARLIEERGPDATCIRMRAVPCPRCGGGNTSYRIVAPPK
jgi:hypothetical protein